MAYGLLSAGQSTKNQALAGLRQSAAEETNRNIANKNIEQMELSGKKQMAGTGAGIGAMMGVNAASSAISAGTAAAGTGTMLASGLASGGIGLLAGWALSELF